MTDSHVVTTASFDVRGKSKPMEARILRPEWSAQNGAWVCRFEIEPPISTSQDVYGESGIQALCLALKLLSSVLYGSELYKNKRLGACGEFGGYLGLPAPSEFLRSAPYPF
jgi:hypothetical protein